MLSLHRSKFGDHIIMLSVCLTALLLSACVTAPFEGNPMPKEQVAEFIEPVTPSSAYDTPPKFLRGFAPFFPEGEGAKRHRGYALLEFNVASDGATNGIRVIAATTYPFAEEAFLAVREWRFTPAKKNGQPVVVRVRMPFTFED